MNRPHVSLLLSSMAVLICLSEHQGLLAMENIYDVWVLDPARQYDVLLKENRKVDISREDYLRNLGAALIAFDIGEKKIEYSAGTKEVISVRKVEYLGDGQVLLSGTKENDLEERPDKRVMVARLKITLTKKDEAEIQIGDAETLGARFQVRRKDQVRVVK